MSRKQTPSQTVGPYFAYGLTPEQYGYDHTSIAGPALVLGEIEGERIALTGRVLDAEGQPVDDAMIEIWQADANGRYAHPAGARGSNADFAGFGRAGTGCDAENRFVFETIKPGAIGDGQAPHINVVVFARGLLSHLFTRAYFADETSANAADPVLQTVEEARRGTLIAERRQTATGPQYHFDIHLGGVRETVFFDV